MKYDLEERTAIFGENIIMFLKKLTQDNINSPIIKQLIRSATSIGANYMEANQAASKKDFHHKIRISQKESNESKHWLRMLAKCVDDTIKVKCRELWQEAHELTLIFAKISKSRSDK